MKPQKNPQLGGNPRGRGKARATLELIAVSREILAEIQPATVRAVCYRLFTRGLIVSMSKLATDKVSRALVAAREEGTIPWSWLVDETRETETAGTWANSTAIIDAAVRQYRRDYWQDQPHRVEVWSEKGTVRGTLAPILRKYGLAFRVMHGFASATVVRSVADESISDPRPLTALYVGDYDPSGLYMSEVDLPERVHRYGGRVDVMRVALRLDDVAGLPSFEAATKSGDARYRWFIDRYGPRCWEVDAMAPPILREKVESWIGKFIDVTAWRRALEVEHAETVSMAEFLATWHSMMESAGRTL